MPLDPALFASVPYGSATALLDFSGTLQLYMRNLTAQVFALTGISVREVPLGDPGGPQWLEAVQSQYVAIASALGVDAPPDLSSYDLAEPSDHASFFFQLAQETRALRNATGLA